MKITSIRSITGGVPLPEPGFWPAWWPGFVIRDIGFSIVVVETDEGLSGFGPGFARVGPSGWASEGYIREKVLGADPFHIGALATIPENRPMARQTRPLQIEMALWDLLGKATGQPVYKLLGGYRSRVKAYCSTGSVLSPEAHIDQAWDAHGRGYRAIKLRLHREDVADDIAAVRAVREALPHDMEIMADANQAQNPYWSRATALRAARALQEMGVVWLEEPLPMYDLDGLNELAAKVEIPIAGAENQYLLYAYRTFVDRRALDILQPDLMGCGGMLEFHKIAALCQAHVMPCIPHLWSNGLVMACMLHAIGSVPNAPYAECTDDVMWPAPIRDCILTQPHRIVEGMVEVPQGPGWGVHLDWEVVERRATRDDRIEI
jgi:L-alanine-DL-glutamate epimerase-like enolase superfamily enzyme